MRVICRKCRGLIPEEEAIKLSMFDYKCLEQVSLGIPFQQYMQEEHNQYTQICEKCYKAFLTKRTT